MTCSTLDELSRETGGAGLLPRLLCQLETPAEFDSISTWRLGAAPKSAGSLSFPFEPQEGQAPPKGKQVVILEFPNMKLMSCDVAREAKPAL